MVDGSIFPFRITTHACFCHWHMYIVLQSCADVQFVIDVPDVSLVFFGLALAVRFIFFKLLSCLVPLDTTIKHKLKFWLDAT